MFFLRRFFMDGSRRGRGGGEGKGRGELKRCKSDEFVVPGFLVHR